MRLAWLGLVVALAAAAYALVVLPVEDAVPLGDDDEGPRALSASVTASPMACSLCHYAWEVPFRFNGTVEETEAGWRYTLHFSPTAAYNLTDVRIVPVQHGDEAMSVFRLDSVAEVALGATDVTTFHVPLDASGLHVWTRSTRDYGRSVLDVTLVTPDGATVTSLGVGSAHAITHAPEGGIVAGYYDVRIRYVDGPVAVEEVEVYADIAPAGATVVPLVADGATVPVVLDLPAPVSGFAVQLRPMNEHPTEKWLLPHWGDFGEVSVFVDDDPPPAPRNWSVADVDALWGSDTERLLHETMVDGVFVRAHDERGEWTRRGHYLTPPGPEEPFPPLPPGTREVEAVITWSPRTPASPAPAPFLGWAHGAGPTFYYPDPVEEAEGRRVYRIPVEPAWWQAPDAIGGFQAFALLPLDEQGTTTYDGSIATTLTVRR